LARSREIPYLRRPGAPPHRGFLALESEETVCNSPPDARVQWVAQRRRRAA